MKVTLRYTCNITTSIVSLFPFLILLGFIVDDINEQVQTENEKTNLWVSSSCAISVYVVVFVHVCVCACACACV